MNSLTPATSQIGEHDFTLALSKHRSILTSYASTFVGPNDSEDIVQSAYLNAYLHLSSFNGDSTLLTWLYSIVRNESLAHMRRRRGKTRDIRVEVQAVNLDLLTSEQVSIESICIHEQNISQLKQAILTLPRTMRTQLTLYLNNGKGAGGNATLHRSKKLLASKIKKTVVTRTEPILP